MILKLKNLVKNLNILLKILGLAYLLDGEQKLIFSFAKKLLNSL